MGVRSDDSDSAVEATGMGDDPDHPVLSPTIRDRGAGRRAARSPREGDEEAFVTLVTRYQQPMLRLARSFVPSQAVAEEAVQDTWMGVVRGVEGFQGRSSFKTWLFRILVNRARRPASENSVTPLRAPSAVDPVRFDAKAWADPSSGGPKTARIVSMPRLGCRSSVQP